MSDKRGMPVATPLAKPKQRRWLLLGAIMLALLIAFIVLVAVVGDNSHSCGPGGPAARPGCY